jgi:hypothetical protein
MFFERQKQRSNEENIGRGRVIVCFNFFEKNNSRPLFSSSLISFSFLICFE